MKRQVKGLTAEGENIFALKPISALGPGTDVGTVGGRRPFMKSLGDPPDANTHILPPHYHSYITPL